MAGYSAAFRLVPPGLVLAAISLPTGRLQAQPPPASGWAAVTYQRLADSLYAAALQDSVAAAVQAREACTPSELGERNWIDWLNRKVSRTVCGSALWFDGFFGDASVYDERDATYGRIFVALWWDRRDKIDPTFRFRVKANFPRLKRRVNFIIGRESVDNFITDSPDAHEGMPQSLSTSEEESWFVGMGYSPISDRHSRIDLDVGAKLNIPVNPYAKLRYRQNIFFSESTMARFRQTFFWERTIGFGETTRLDFDWKPSQKVLTRLFGLGTVSQSSLGLDWHAGVILYQYLGTAKALAYQAEVRGETRREVPLRDYALTVVYRFSTFRPWLFVELSAGVSWPRESLEEVREINPGLGIGFEMQYGTEP
jgi:hypothetical protein